jgi:hypothetical protein
MDAPTRGVQCTSSYIIVFIQHTAVFILSYHARVLEI